MSPIRAARWVAAFGGVLLWLAIPYVVSAGGAAQHTYRCRGRVFTGSFDGCFNDYIPVFELMFVPLFILVTAYPFARFAFTLYAPAPRPPGIVWKLSGRSGAAGGWPYLQLLACLLCAWAIWRELLYAPASELLPFRLYCGAFALWFAAGALVGVADRRAEMRSGAA